MIWLLHVSPSLMQKEDRFWELQIRNLSINQIQGNRIKWFANEIRKSNRVKIQIKEHSDLEIAEHYHLIEKNQLTNLGILWLGSASQRARLSYPISVQYIVYDELENN